MVRSLATILIFSSLTLGCATAPAGLLPTGASPMDWQPAVTLSPQDAIRVLGESSHLDGAVAYMSGTAKVYAARFSADVRDSVSGKTGTIYFMYEEYANPGLAQDAYRSIFAANAKSPGVLARPGIADEAYFHGDGQNFLFALVRSGKALIRVKVNKTTTHTDEAAFRDLYESFWK